MTPVLVPTLARNKYRCFEIDFGQKGLVLIRLTYTTEAFFVPQHALAVSTPVAEPANGAATGPSSASRLSG
jgi:hypothetical protein